MIGIYQIKNLVTNKLYIGSSINIESRWNLHKHDLRKNKHHSIYLQRSFNIYGEGDFEFSVLEECNKDILIEREQYYLDTLTPKYNINNVADNCTGRIVSKETRDKISKANKGKKHSEETKKKMSDYRKSNPINFSREVREKIRQSKLGSKNPMFGKKTSQKQKDAVRESLIGKKRSEEVKERISRKNSIPVVQLNLNKDFLKEWKSTMEIERSLEGFFGNSVTRCCKNKRKTYKGYIWMYKSEYEKL